MQVFDLRYAMWSYLAIQKQATKWNMQTKQLHSQNVFKSNWIIWFHHAKHVVKRYFMFFFLSFYRFFHLQKHISALAVNITMESLFISHTCQIPLWNMHVMSRLNFITESDDSFNFNYILHPNGLCWAKFHLYQVIFKCFKCISLNLFVFFFFIFKFNFN